jgi:hypothetical protein
MYRRVIATFVACFFFPACDDIHSDGALEPIRVQGAAFRRERMLGLPPRQGEAQDEVPGPRVTSFEVAGAIFYPNQQGRRLAGRVSDDAWAIGVRMVDHGTGYWVLPVEGPDPLANGELTYELDLMLQEAPTGLQRLRLVALDEAGRGGPQRDIEICVASRLPDNLNACEPSLKPPEMVVALTWDAQADLDLVLLGPDGQMLDARRPLGNVGEGPVDATALRDPTLPRLRGDSNADCRIDGRRLETVVFQEPPAGQTWLAYVRPHSFCGARSARARLEVFRRVSTGGTTWRLQSVATADAFFLAEQATGTLGPGTYVLPLVFP